MRKLDRTKRELIVKCLSEGCGVNSTARLVGVAKLSVLRLLCDLGKVCKKFHDKNLRGVSPRHIEIDECWGFVGCKARGVKEGKAGHGDVWVWIAQDSDSRLVLAYHAGDRQTPDAMQFLSDLADRVTNSPQISSDAWPPYDLAIRSAFGDRAHWAKIIKVFGKSTEEDRRKYSPPECISCRKEAVIGTPNIDECSTSLIERQNLSLRMKNRRMTRLTNSFSRALANHIHALHLHYWFHNYSRKVSTLKMTPAQKAGLTNRQWTASDLLDLLEFEEEQEAFGPVGSRINRADRS